MASKKNQQLRQRAKETTRRPDPSRLQEPERKKSYKVVAVSLYTPEATFIDQATKALRRAGNLKANRSLVVQEAILRLQEALKGKTEAEVLRDFNEHQAQRPQQND